MKQPVVRLVLTNHEVLVRVVQGYAIDVMHLRPTREAVAEYVGHDLDMRKDVTIRACTWMVSIGNGFVAVRAPKRRVVANTEAPRLPLDSPDASARPLSNGRRQPASTLT
jgi:hypothetical protein